MFNSAIAPTLLTAIVLTLGSIDSALAATMPLSFSRTAAGTTGPGTVTPLAVPGSYTYGNSFGNLTTTLYTPAGGPSAGINFEFYDAYVFTISGANVSSISSTITLGNIFAIDNLQARIYNTAGNPTVPVLGMPVGGAFDGWSDSYSAGSNTVTVAIIDDIPLAAGTYVLELRGSVSGLAGGSYSGVLNANAVPVPAAAWLMGSALVGLAGIGRRRNRV